MAMTDPIADMLTRIRNANSVNHDKVEIPGSKIKTAIAEVLKQEGFIKDFTFTQDNKQGILTVFLKYGNERENVISGIQRISKPGLRQYSKKKDFWAGGLSFGRSRYRNYFFITENFERHLTEKPTGGIMLLRTIKRFCKLSKSGVAKFFYVQEENCQQ